VDKIEILLSLVLLSLVSACNLNSQSGDESGLIFQDEAGNQVSWADLNGVTGTYNWEVMDDIEVSDAAKQLHQAARMHGSKEQYEQAIEKLQEANRLAPDWAFPVYDLAYTYLLNKDFANALKYYKLTDAMKPKGFFTAKTACWSLEKEAAGEFQEGLYLAYLQIEWMKTDEEQLQLARAIVENIPQYAPAWKVIAQKANDTAERLRAIEQGLNAAPDAETKGMLLINKALVKDLQNERQEAINILGALILHESTTLANVELAKYVLSTIAQE